MFLFIYLTPSKTSYENHLPISEKKHTWGPLSQDALPDLLIGEWAVLNAVEIIDELEFESR
jgi:hypothetical protein